uniref:Uncharacterized protein n=1 Tax=Rhizophora mucronata TaxID=61149 RepID=A0A2P2MBC6_RHIMU
MPQYPKGNKRNILNSVFKERSGHWGDYSNHLQKEIYTRLGKTNVAARTYRNILQKLICYILSPV